MPVSRTIAFATYADEPGGTPDDHIALAPLAAHGIAVTPLAWNDPAADWSRFDAVVLRSTWDYYHHLDAFLAWCAAVEKQGIALINPLAIVEPNTDKRYLQQMESAGAPVIPTAWPEPSELLGDVMARHGWTDVVVKPAVSAGAFETFRVQRAGAGAAQERVDMLRARGPVLVQPYRAEIEDDGELSLVFFDGRYSHALVKHPKAGDFRVQPRHGGTARPYHADPELVVQASRVLAFLPETPLYARVDGLLLGGHFHLMELELVEPALYFATDSTAAERFAGALAARIT